MKMLPLKKMYNYFIFKLQPQKNKYVKNMATLVNQHAFLLVDTLRHKHYS